MEHLEAWSISKHGASRSMRRYEAMALIVDDLRPEVVIPAMEENFVQWWRYFARAPQAIFHDEPEISWLHSGNPLPEYNGVVRAQLRPERSVDEVADEVADVIADVIAATARSHALNGVGMSWYITPSTRPTDLGEHLQARGFVLSGTVPGMAIDLATEQVGVMTPGVSAFQVVRVSNAALLRQWVNVLVSSFQESEAVRQARYTGQEGLGWAEDSALQRYLAFLDGEPVATSALFLDACVAGFNEVVTAPQHRRRGLATSVMLATMDAARRRGYRIGVLQASPMGESVYRRLGFSELCRFSHYFLRAM
jgi:GNAT superfamily N-acetyltransferase